MKKNKIELKQCPFCNSKNIRIIENWRRITCDDCLIVVSQSEATCIEDVITAWNTRHIDNFGRFMNEPEEE